MLTLVTNLVEMAHLNNGEIALQLEECSITDLLEDVIDRWKLQNPQLPMTTRITISAPILKVDRVRQRQLITNLLNYASIRVTEGVMSVSARDDEQGVYIDIQSAGKKARDKSEMDSAMLGFICASLIKLHGGKMDEPQETEDGMLLSFSLPRS